MNQFKYLRRAYNSQPNTIAVVGGSPSLFIATPNIQPQKIIECILQIASHSNPPDQTLLSKWRALNEWLRKGGTLTPWNNSETGISKGESTVF